MKPTQPRSTIVPALCAMALVLCSPPRSADAAQIRRFALVVGANDGGADRVRLRYAVSDARSMARVLQQLGGIAKDDVKLLVEPKHHELQAAIAALRAALERARGRREVVFYYSGHSDERGLLLRGRHFTYLRIRQAIRNLPADVRIAVLDSCASGSITRRKGGVRKPPFLVDTAGHVRGHAFLTSASANESAQESDRIRGSFFTHHLVSGLRGAADSDRDRRVTLNEAYRYAFNETLAQTESTRSGPQHANYDMQLVGRGQIVLTELRGTAAILEFPADVRGRLFVRDARGDLVAEINKRRAVALQLGLQAGRYTVTVDGKRRGTIVLKPRSRHLLRLDELSQPIATVATTRRGGPPEPQQVAAAPEAAPRHVPFALTVFPYLGLGGQVTTNVSLGLLASHYAVLRGVDVSGIAAIGTLDVRGVQLSGAYSHVGRDLTGVQISGGGNYAGGDARGAQVTGLFNVVGNDLLAGAQISGALNWVGRDMLWLQLTGGANWAGGDMGGVQVAGLYNGARGLVDGVQIAGVVNMASDVVDGVQVAGVFNRAPVVEGAQVSGMVNSARLVRGAQVGVLNIGGRVVGTQVGLVNIGGDVSATQVGLINIANHSDRPIGLLNLIGNGMHHLEVWGSDSAYANVGLKLGGKHLYSVLAAGIQPKGDLTRWMLGVGFGGRIPLGGRLALDADLLHWQINEDEAWTTKLNFLENVRLVLRYRVAANFAVHAGATFNVLISRLNDGGDFGLIHGHVAHSGTTTVRLWPGFVLGLSI